MKISESIRMCLLSGVLGSGSEAANQQVLEREKEDSSQDSFASLDDSSLASISPETDKVKPAEL